MDIVGALLGDGVESASGGADSGAPGGGLTCVVGAGGKKTTIYVLANRLDRAVVTATVRIPIFDAEVAAVAVDPDPVAALADAGAWPLGLVPARDRADRYRGYDPGGVAALAEAHDGPVLVKADGARTREFKAPGDDEPRIPAAADAVIPVASVQAVGEPLTEERVHRPERVAALTDLAVGDAVTPPAMATVLAHPDGGLAGVPPDASVVPLLNKVDGADDERVAAAVAEGVLARTDRVDRVVCARMLAANVVDVVRRRDR